MWLRVKKDLKPDNTVEEVKKKIDELNFNHSLPKWAYTGKEQARYTIELCKLQSLLAEITKY